MATRKVVIHASLLFNPKTKSFESNITLEIDPETGLITSLTRRSSSDVPPATTNSKDITTHDLRHLTVTPGLVDAHTHIFLHPYSQTPALSQIRDESAPERIVRSIRHLRSALLAGYTTYRDLGTEGLGDADVGVRDAVNRGLTPGPRLFVATEALASSGGYEARIENRLGGDLGTGVSVPRIADVCDGAEGVRAAVRRRLGAGADVIKVYADYRRRALRWPASSWPGCAEICFPPTGGFLGGDRNPNLSMWCQEEMDEIVREAERGDAPVAAHCIRDDSVIQAASAGVTTVEHAATIGDEALAAMKKHGTIWVPTLSVFELFLKEAMGTCLARVKKGWDMGMKIAAGGDTGAFAHGDNMREVELLIEAGIPVEDALTSATLHGWEACGGRRAGRKFGWLEEGCAADIVAFDGDPRGDVGALRRVVFVMKDGKEYKVQGDPVNMM